jgi:hypothetical protein
MQVDFEVVSEANLLGHVKTSAEVPDLQGLICYSKVAELTTSGSALNISLYRRTISRLG